jgi:recombination protein RecA
VKVVKNKVAPPFKEVEFDILYGSGISHEGDLLDLAALQNLVEKSGSWYSFNGERIGQGREQAKEFFKAHPELMAEVEKKIFDKAGLKPRAGNGNGSTGAAAIETPIEEPAEEKRRARAK